MSRLFHSLVLLLVTVGGCGRGAAGNAKPPAAPEVLVQTVRAENVPIYAESVGTIDGALNAEIRARVAGVITSQPYREGTFVRKGQLLFTIDPSLTAAAARKAHGDLGAASAALAKAEADLNRLEPLVGQRLISQQELDNARAARQIAYSNLQAATGSRETASANLSYTHITAPIAGLAGIAQHRVGSLVGQGEPTLLTTISQIDPVRVSYAVSEQWYLSDPKQFQGGGASAGTSERAQPNAHAPAAALELVLADGSTYPHRGRISFADRQVDPSTGTLTVIASFPNPDGLLRPGMYAKLRAVREVKKDVICVPQRAVTELQGAAQVVVVGPGDRTETRPVTTGDRVGSRWVITSGLKPGERVIVEGLQKVGKAGVVVTPRPMPPDPPAKTLAREH